MLNVKVREHGDKTAYTDNEVEFSEIELERTPKVEILLKNIDKATYCDSNSFYDRWNDKVSTQFLSTGCKTALLVAMFPNKLIDTIECGKNALTEIIVNCREGNIIVRELLSPIEYPDETPIEVEIEGNTFHTVGELNDYLF